MHQQRCVCPHCGTTLRVKDRGYLNRPVPCPDCRALLVISLTADDQLEAQLVDQPAVPVAGVQADKIKLNDQDSWSSRARSWATNVTVISWAATLLVAGMIGLAVFRPKPAPRKPVPETIADPQIVEPPEPQREPSLEPKLPEPAPTAVIAGEAPETLPADPPADDRDLPIDPLLAAEPEPLAPAPEPPAIVVELPPAIDLEARLAQPLKSFRQDRKISRRDLLDLLEEMLAAPIRYDAEALGDEAQQLDQTLSFEMEDTTVGDVLAKVLDQTELTYDIERDGLRLHRKDPVPDTESP